MLVYKYSYFYLLPLILLFNISFNKFISIPLGGNIKASSTRTFHSYCHRLESMSILEDRFYTIQATGNMEDLDRHPYMLEVYQILCHIHRSNRHL